MNVYMYIFDMLKQHCECIILALSFFGSCFFKVNISSIFSYFCHCHHTVSVTNSLAIFFSCGHTVNLTFSKMLIKSLCLIISDDNR